MIAGHLLILIVFLSARFANGLPLKSLENPKLAPVKVLNFLKNFGYLEEDDGKSEALYTEDGISETIKIVQRYGGIEETGILDNATLKLISSPRCGVPDIIRNKRSKRFAFGSEGWNKRTITYYVANWSPKLGENAVMKNIQMALDTWGKYGHLTFHRVGSPDADIIVAFGSGYHGDRFPFDGPGNILAHAFFPYESNTFGGDIHFDADEDWTDRNNGGKEDGMDFATVALHELGHSLGLAHSTDATSVMFPYYKGYEAGTQFQLSYDDILGMYQLYIRRNINETFNPTTSRHEDDDSHETSTYFPEISSTSVYSTIETTEATSLPFSTTSRAIYEGDDESVDDHKNHDNKHNVPSTNSPSLPYICNGYFDAVATLRGELFIFKEQYVWRLEEMSKIKSGYPITIYQMFPDLPKTIKQIDAAYERPDAMIVLFTGDQFWVYDGKYFIENSPNPLFEYGLPPTLDKVDAVQTWNRNGKTYIYKHDRFWRYNETSRTMDEDYPKHMERWRGVPHDLDAATTWRGVTYFFKGELYWKFDNEWITITEQSPFPAPQLWLGCPEEEPKMSQLFQEEQ